MSGPQLNVLPRIDSIWAVVSVDDDGTEGLCGILTQTGWLPLIVANEKNLPDIRAEAIKIAKRDQRLVRIVRLHQREELELIDFRQ